MIYCIFQLNLNDIICIKDCEHALILFVNVLLPHPQRTCHLHGAQDHDPSGRLHVCGSKEEEAHPKTVKEFTCVETILIARFVVAFSFSSLVIISENC